MFEDEKTEVGCEIGEVCNRNGCKGILADDGELDGLSCNCHISPPCSKCTHDPAYCPECDWEPEQP